MEQNEGSDASEKVLKELSLVWSPESDNVVYDL